MMGTTGFMFQESGSFGKGISAVGFSDSKLEVYTGVLQNVDTCPMKFVKFLKSEGRSLSVESVYNYLEWLEKAFVIYRCRRYDLQGKSVLKTQGKFYFADTSLKYCMMGFHPNSIAAMLENMHLADFLLNRLK